VIFDCCHSGSGTRSFNTDLPRTRRSVQIPSNIPSSLDRHIWGDSEDSRSGRVASGFLYSGLKSHVLLAACGVEQSAFDDPILQGGVFTSAILSVLEATGTESITYAEALQRMDPLPEFVIFLH
jgi:Caspase domain